MFTQKCFIRKNTPEIVNALEQLGYGTLFSARKGYGEYLCCYNNIVTGTGDRVINYEFIDCGTNEELFLAIASLRDDTDRNQWFTDGNGYWQQCIGSFKFPSLAKEKLHKATVQELIEHFKP